MQFSEINITISDLNLHYLEGGNKKGKVILFLHGVTYKATTYHSLLTILSEKFYIIAPDLPGFGGSDLPKTIWNYQDYAEFIEKFVKTFSNDFIVIGHSFGAGIGIQIATSNSNQVKKLICLNPASVPIQFLSIRRMFNFVVLKSFNDVIYYDNFSVWSKQLYDGLVNIFKRLPHIYRLFRIFSIATHQETLYEKIKIPVLLIFGEKDEVIPLNHSELLHESIRTSTLITVQGNHDWCFLFPKECLTKIQLFLQNR